MFAPTTIKGLEGAVEATDVVVLGVVVPGGNWGKAVPPAVAAPLLDAVELEEALLSDDEKDITL